MWKTVNVKFLEISEFQGKKYFTFKSKSGHKMVQNMPKIVNTNENN